ncbi:MAG: cytochrome c biogenesis protein/redoxin, partial [Acidimicrobiales bacterium]
MVELILIGFVAGVVAGISPCVLPVLPVILVAGATTPETPRSTPDLATRVDGPHPDGPHPDGPDLAGQTAVELGLATLGEAPAGGVTTLRPPRAGALAPSPGAERAGAAGWWRAQARPVSVVAGLVVSFSLVVLAGSEIISAFDLPEEFLRDAGIVILVVVGLSFLFPPLFTVLEKPFSRMTTGRQPNGKAGGFVLGLGLGLLFVPCAGPVLAAITVAGATHRVGWTALFLAVAFAAGVAVPLLVVAVAGGQLVERTKALRRYAPRVRQIGGLIVLVMALTIGLNTFSGLQRDVPGYTSALQNKIEGGAKVRKQLSSLGTNKPKHASLVDCSSTATSLINCGPAPNFVGITAWLNTPGSRPLSMAQLRGKVVLVDFWTYSCINCQRALPHVEAWYSRYEKDGLEVVGVET